MMSHFPSQAAVILIAGVVAIGHACAKSSPTQPGAVASVRADPQPTIAAISPNIGSTGGRTLVTITGAGFTSASIVTFGGARVVPRFDSRNPGGWMFVTTPAQPVGLVDVIVTNAGGQSGSMAAGFSYVSPLSFDPNGTWTGFGDAGQDIALGFTVRANVVLSVSCDTSVVAFDPPLLVSNGEFSFLSGDGAAVSGRIVSPSTAAGTMNIAACTDTSWNATRR